MLHAIILILESMAFGLLAVGAAYAVARFIDYAAKLSEDDYD